MNETRAILQIWSFELKNLKIQLGQMVEIFSAKQQMSLPNTLKMNLEKEDMEHTKGIILRSMGEIEEPQELEEVEEVDADELYELVEKESLLQNQMK